MQNYYSNRPRRQNDSHNSNDYLRQIADDIADLKLSVADLRENRVVRSDVYTREVIDGMVRDMHDEVAQIKDTLKEQKDQLYRMLLIASSIVGIIVLFAQHIQVR